MHTYVSVDTIVQWLRLWSRGLIKPASKIGFAQVRDVRLLDWLQNFVATATASIAIPP
jgi:hypothetical protein